MQIRIREGFQKMRSIWWLNSVNNFGKLEFKIKGFLFMNK